MIRCGQSLWNRSDTRLGVAFPWDLGSSVAVYSWLRGRANGCAKVSPTARHILSDPTNSSTEQCFSKCGWNIDCHFFWFGTTAWKSSRGRVTGLSIMTDMNQFNWIDILLAIRHPMKKHFKRTCFRVTVYLCFPTRGEVTTESPIVSFAQYSDNGLNRSVDIIRSGSSRCHNHHYHRAIGRLDQSWCSYYNDLLDLFINFKNNSSNSLKLHHCT